MTGCAHVGHVRDVRGESAQAKEESRAQLMQSTRGTAFAFRCTNCDIGLAPRNTYSRGSIALI